MWNYEDDRVPVHTFEGHTDVVKEFVWRAREGVIGGKFLPLVPVFLTETTGKTKRSS